VVWRRGPSIIQTRKDPRYSESITLPLARDGKTVDHVVSVVELRRDALPDECLCETGCTKTG
jgi:hypothetical protein